MDIKEEYHSLGRRSDYRVSRREEIVGYVKEHPEMRLEDIATHFGITRSLVGRYLRDMGVSRRPVNKRVREKVSLCQALADTLGVDVPEDLDLLEFVREHEKEWQDDNG